MGVPATDLLTQLMDKGFTAEQACKALGKNLPSNIKFRKDAKLYRKLAAPALVRNLSDTRARYLENERAQLIQLDDFLFSHQCDQLINLSRCKLERSQVASKSGYSEHRTSSTCELSILNDAFVNKVNQHIVNTLGVGIGENENIQAQHYAIDQEFKLHSDYFDPASEGWELHGRRRGQRTWTFMVYLSEGCRGGETEFPKLGLKISPKKGTALIWNNLHKDGTPNPYTMHQSHPVIAGEKVIITKWFRDQQQ